MSQQDYPYQLQLEDRAGTILRVIEVGPGLDDRQALASAKGMLRAEPQNTKLQVAAYQGARYIGYATYRDGVSLVAVSAGATC